MTSCHRRVVLLTNSVSVFASFFIFDFQYYFFFSFCFYARAYSIGMSDFQVARSSGGRIFLLMSFAVFCCLANDLPATCLQNDMPNLNGGNIMTGTTGATLVSLGCVSVLPASSVQAAPPMSQTVFAEADEVAYNDTISCAAQCGVLGGALQTSSGGVQFAVYNHTCYCVNQTTPVYVANTTGSACRYLEFYRLVLVCSLNASRGCGSGCSLDIASGCCVVAPAPPPPALPAYYRTMIQWVAIIVIALALLEAVAYACLRGRRRRRDTARQSSALRDAHEAKVLSQRLLSHFPASPSAADEPSLADDACPICLDPITAKASLCLPCGHNIHASCLNEYVAHQLMRVNEVMCPMCRSVVVDVDDDGEDAGINGSRDVRPVRIIVPQ